MGDKYHKLGTWYGDFHYGIRFLKRTSKDTSFLTRANPPNSPQSCCILMPLTEYSVMFLQQRLQDVVLEPRPIYMLCVLFCSFHQREQLEYIANGVRAGR